MHSTMFFGSKKTMILHICILLDVTLFVLKFAVVKNSATSFNWQQYNVEHCIWVRYFFCCAIQKWPNKIQLQLQEHNFLALFGTRRFLTRVHTVKKTFPHHLLYISVIKIKMYDYCQNSKFSFLTPDLRRYFKLRRIFSILKAHKIWISYC